MIKIKLSVFVDPRNDKYIKIDYSDDIKKEKKSTLVGALVDEKFSSLEEKIKIRIFSIDLPNMINLNKKLDIKIETTEEVKTLFMLYNIFVEGKIE